MADINRDLDKYLRRRKVPAFEEQRAVKAPEEKLSRQEMRKLEAMEEEIKQGERRIEAVKEFEEELEESQEKRVGLYHQVLRFFTRSRKQPDFEELPIDEAPDEEVIDDFRILASIFLRWLERLPKRSKDEFRESDDYEIFSEILERRGVARRK